MPLLSFSHHSPHSLFFPQAAIRNVALTLRRDKSMAAVNALTELGDEGEVSAVHALVGLISQSPKSSPPQTPSPHEDIASIWSPQHTSRHSEQRHSPMKQPRRSKPSLLAPWKATSGVCDLRHKRPHKVAVAKRHMANLSSLSMAVTQAADG